MSFAPPPPPSGSPQGPPPQQTPRVVIRPPGNGLAVAALVLGLCSLIPFLGVFCAVAAIFLAMMALAKKRPGKTMAAVGLVVAVVGILESAGLMGLLVYKYNQRFGIAGQAARRTMCATNLKTLGVNVALYMAEYDAPPAGIQVLVQTQGMSAQVLQCPSANTPGRASVFILLPKTTDLPPAAIVACDYRGNHPDGRNVLFGGWHVAFLREADFQTELADPKNAAFAAALRAKEGP